MAQPHFWFLVLFLFMEPRDARKNDAPLTVTGILGESAILPTKVPSNDKLDNINWSSLTPVAHVQREGTLVKIFATHQKYGGRLSVPPDTYNLKISPLKMEDAGHYRADINFKDPTTNEISSSTKNYTLHVYRRLAPPKITWNAIPSENNTCNITLTCFMEEGREAVRYQWTPLGEQAVESSGNSRLFVFQRPKDAHINYTCTATNPVSNNSQSILLQPLCAEEERKTQRFPQSHTAGTLVTFDPLWHTLLSLLEMLIIIILVGGGFYLWHKKKNEVVAP